MTELTFEYIIEHWVETDLDDMGTTFRTASVAAAGSVAGNATGVARSRLLLAYTGPKSGSFVGVTQISGMIGGREGTVILRDSGTFTATSATNEWTLIAANGEFSALSGSGHYHAEHGHGPIHCTLRLSSDRAA